MPRCKECGVLIHSGQTCDVCGREEQLVSYEEPDGPDYVECETCDGKAYIVVDGKTQDCPDCGGFGRILVDKKPIVLADGGQHEDIIVADDGGEIIDE